MSLILCILSFPKNFGYSILWIVLCISEIQIHVFDLSVAGITASNVVHPAHAPLHVVLMQMMNWPLHAFECMRVQNVCILENKRKF